MKQKITSFEKNLHLFGCFPSKTLLFRGGFPLFYESLFIVLSIYI